MIQREWAVGLFFLLFLFGCGDAIYSEKVERNEDAWAYKDIETFKFEAPDTQNLYDIQLTLTHSKDFDYQNLYLRLHTIFPKGDTIRQPFSIDLSDKFGQWLGQCGANSCSLTSVLQPSARFEQFGTYQLLFEQYSREDSLSGVQSLEVSIYPAKK